MCCYRRHCDVLQRTEGSLRCSDRPKQYLLIHVVLFILLLLPLCLAANTFVGREDKILRHHSEPLHSGYPFEGYCVLGCGVNGSSETSLYFCQNLRHRIPESSNIKSHAPFSLIVKFHVPVHTTKLM